MRRDERARCAGRAFVIAAAREHIDREHARLFAEDAVREACAVLGEGSWRTRMDGAAGSPRGLRGITTAQTR